MTTNKDNMKQAIEEIFNGMQDYDAWFFDDHENCERYDYEKSVYCGIIWFLNDMLDRDIESFAQMEDDEREEWINNEAFISDTVTGNASGSFFYNRWKAECAIMHNWDLIEETIDEFGPLEFSRGAEYIDVSIRCYILGQVIGQVIDAINEKISEIEDQAERDFIEEQNENKKEETAC